MMKFVSKFEVVIDGKLFQLFCDHDSNTTQCKEFLFQFNKFIIQVEDAYKMGQEKSKIIETDLPVTDSNEKPQIESSDVNK